MLNFLKQVGDYAKRVARYIGQGTHVTDHHMQRRPITYSTLMRNSFLSGSGAGFTLNLISAFLAKFVSGLLDQPVVPNLTRPAKKKLNHYSIDFGVCIFVKL